MKTKLKTGTHYCGKIDYNGTGRQNCPVEIEWSLTQGENGLEFSASGNVWMPSRKDIFAGGQILDEIADWFPDDAKAIQICLVWKQFHLNGMKAGLPAQENAIADWQAEGGVYEYDTVCAMLKDRGLYEIPLPDGVTCTGDFPAEVKTGARGYRYGERWVYSAIPAEVITEIQSW